MSTFRLLDVAIGMTFFFLLISLICTALHELLEAIVKRRAKHLEQGIYELLVGHEHGLAKDTSEVVKDFYSHPLISGLFQGPYKLASRMLPSYIPARSFALAIMDVVATASKDTASGATGATAAVSTDPDGNLARFRSALQKLPDIHLKKSLLTLTDAAENDVAQLRENIETWYNNSMDRVAGWYKRRTQWVLLVLGLLLAIGLNADAIAVFKSLSNDPVRRDAVVAMATQMHTASNNDTTQTPQERIDQTLTQLEELRLPIGWDWHHTSDANTSPAKAINISNRQLALPTLGPDVVRNIGVVLQKLLGWFITGIAVSLGAPFWFDMLNKIMVIRSTVKPHEKSQEEASEDRQDKSTASGKAD